MSDGGLFGVRLSAQREPATEVDLLLKRVAESYAAQPHMEVTAYTRELRVQEVRDAESSTPTYRAASAEYGRLVLTRRLPDDWRVVSQREQVSRGEAQPSRTLVFGKIGTGESSMLLLNRSTQATVRMAIPEGMFQQEVKERIGRTGVQDPLLRLFFDGMGHGSSEWVVFHGSAAELRVEGVDEVDGVRLTRIVSAWPPSTVTRLWIDAETLTLVRVLETPGEQSLRMGMSLEVKETIYRHDFGKGVDDGDFDLDAGWAAATPNIASAAGFSPSTELFAGLTSGGTIKPDAPAAKHPPAPRTPSRPPVGFPSSPNQPGEGGTAKSPSSPSTPSPVPEPAAVEEQLLTREQMEAIVLVNGDEGVGTGFVAKIRGVNFVVTNLHVIGGNAAIRVTTVRGVPVAVAGMFGAAGRDIAILRIEGDYTGPTLKLAEDPLATVKLGEKVAVVGNRRGGGVATQVSGVVQGIGPDRIEVNARFQPGNSGSPIVHVPTGEVIGVASYSQTRELDELDGPANTGSSTGATGTRVTKEEQRWFGYRADAVSRWEAIDLARWQVQAKKIADFEADSRAIHYAMYGRFKEAGSNPRVRALTDRFEERYERLGSSQVAVGQEVQEFFRGLRALADTGVKDLKTGDYYDFFRTSLYWETSITDQLRARAQIAEALDKASQNSAAFLARVRR